MISDNDSMDIRSNTIMFAIVVVVVDNDDNVCLLEPCECCKIQLKSNVTKSEKRKKESENG